MEFSEVIRTTFSARELTDEPVPDDVVAEILDDARFAANGGNRQPWSVIVVRGQAGRDAIVEATLPTARRYIAERLAGGEPLNTVDPVAVEEATVAGTELPAQLTAPIRQAPVLLVVCCDLSRVAVTDQGLDRIPITAGSSIYPFAWSILLAARSRGLGGVLTTLAIGDEPRLVEAFGLPAGVAVAGVIPIGHPLRQLTRLSRHPVSSFARHERFDGEPLGR